MTTETTRHAQTELPLGNQQVAESLDEVADLLEAQGANPFRVQAYRVGADQLRRLSSSVLRLLEVEGVEGLRQLRGIGKSLARAIDQLAHTGKLPLLERLRATMPRNPSLPPYRASAPNWHDGFTTNYTLRHWLNWKPPHATDDWLTYQAWAANGCAACGVAGGAIPPP